MTDKPVNVHFLSQIDAWVGMVLAVAGGAAGWMASGFDAMSRTYPMVLSLLLAGCGLILVFNVFRHKSENVSLVIPVQVTTLSAVIIGLWIVALSNGFGYLLPTFCMQFVFLRLCNIRSPRKIALFAALISGVSYLAFIVGLGVPLPETLASWIL